MRKEHESHVLVISLMLAFILIVFGFVLFNHPLGTNSIGGITTSLPYYATDGKTVEKQDGNSLQIEVSVLIGLLIILVFLFVVYLCMRIFREVKGHLNNR
jgi:hypothetical protein